MAKSKKSKTPKQQPRVARLVADAVAVCCSRCGEAQPNTGDGSDTMAVAARLWGATIQFTPDADTDA